MKRKRRRCAWCSGKRPARATYRTRWPWPVPVEDEFGLDDDHLWWPPPVILLCSFHVRFARRYQGVRAYRLGGNR